MKCILSTIALLFHFSVWLSWYCIVLGNNCYTCACSLRHSSVERSLFSFLGFIVHFTIFVLSVCCLCSGVHHKKKDCSSRHTLGKVYRTMNSARRAQYPLKLIIMHAPPKKVSSQPLRQNYVRYRHSDKELVVNFNTCNIY